MARLVLEQITKSFGTAKVLDGVELTIGSGEFVSFLGPSGCGKTTLLRMIAGLESVTSGRILLDGSDLVGTPVNERGIGMVFQSLALFSHLTVAENIGYGLRIAGERKDVIMPRVEELLRLVALEGFAERQISQLSGGQRQRVAIARALARNPRLFLLDEPMSALDAQLREQMQIELRILQQKLGVTTIAVTHDQREAMTMSDKIVVMSPGRIEQVGSPEEIYHRPANGFVAGFIGESNLLPVSPVGDKVRFQDVLLCVSEIVKPSGGGALVLSVRPEDVILSTDTGTNALRMTVTFLRDLGESVQVLLEGNATTLRAKISKADRALYHPGQDIHAILPPKACRVVPQ